MRINNSISSPNERPYPLVLVSEISSRVINEYTQAIAFIRLAAAGLASAEGRDALVEAAAKLLRFAEAHRALQRPQQAERVDLGQYLGRVCAASLAAGLQDRGVKLQLSCDVLQLDSERCWRVALIVSELVNNSARHGLRGGSGKITIEVAEDGCRVICRVSDNGSVEPTAPPSRGSAVVRGIAADLDGELAWCVEPSGSTALLTFPRDLRRTSL